MSLVPAHNLEREIEIKKSRFIARAVPVADREQAMAAVAQARRDHPTARHHCWAYLLGKPESASAAMSDDGEPSGTAGKPILNVIQHKRIGDVIVVVIRYFGGIKLGAGGLVRAYAGATEAVLADLPLVEHQPRISMQLALDFAQEQAVRHWASAHEASVGAVDYGQRVGLWLTLPETAASELTAFAKRTASRSSPADKGLLPGGPLHYS
ncbi:YigZ family protein [Alkalilimnicola ehrlichii]|uniref:YigZ family protein n=1 Tax=Alkalilimnicola ehrlichii TaxID=351052 RepID=A0A3E0WQC9_9GAMM|nr:YigZ family protein [Alkalilimnicola ehrlichii]RFA27294.1 YigZ family protein [Alkalilimnicola ehrlichii]RFA34403.1 YigZ family protein [Alkalilimnicola ehrlichii]